MPELNHCEACGLTAPVDPMALAIGDRVVTPHWTVSRNANYGWLSHNCPEPLYYARMVRNDVQETRYLSLIPRLWRDERFFELTWWFLKLTNSGYDDRLFLMHSEPCSKPPTYKTLFSFKITPAEFALLCPRKDGPNGRTSEV